MSTSLPLRGKAGTLYSCLQPPNSTWVQCEISQSAKLDPAFGDNILFETCHALSRIKVGHLLDVEARSCLSE